jgi:hypothetical protein
MTEIDKFVQAEKLYDFVGSCQLDDGRTVRDAFRLVGSISLWECLSSYLVLYRFPLCIFDSREKGFSYKERFRPLVGTMGRIYDTIISAPILSSDGIISGRSGAKEDIILFLGFNETHFRDVLKSIYLEIRADDSSHKPIVLTGAKGGYYRQNHLSVWDCFSDEAALAVASGLSLTKDLKKALLSTLGPGRCPAPTGVLVDWSALRRELSWLCNREIPRLVYLAAAVNNVLSHFAPSLILTADDADQRSKLVELAARESGTPTLVVQQGFTRSDYPDWRHFKGDYVAAMSSTSLETIVGQGVPRQVVTITGHPGHDKLKENSASETSATRTSIGVASNTFIALFASQPYVIGAYKSENARSEVIRQVCETLSAIEGAQLVIKAHPYESISELKVLCQKCPRTIIIGGEMEIAELIKSCDIFITMFSQTTLEALYVDKPVINIDFPGAVTYSPFRDGRATMIVKCCEELRAAILKMISGDYGFYQQTDHLKAKDAMVFDWAYQNDGLATSRITELIKIIVTKDYQEGRRRVDS